MSIVWIFKPIAYETVADRNYIDNRTIDVFVFLKSGRSESDIIASFAPPNPPLESNKSTQV